MRNAIVRNHLKPSTTFRDLRSERPPALLTICLFGCLASVWGFVCRFSLVVCLNISLPFIQLSLFVQGASVFKLLLRFRNVLKHIKSRSCLLAIKISKKTSQQRRRFSFALKRNERHTCKQILHENIHATRE